MFSPASATITPAMAADENLAICCLDPHGVGVVSLVACSRDAILHHFTGHIGPEIEQHSLQVAEGRHISGTGFVGYLSHGCDPNCRLDMARLELVALSDIAANALLTIDYAATEDRLYAQFACHCGAENCRRWITGRAEAVNAEGSAYLEGVAAGLRPI